MNRTARKILLQNHTQNVIYSRIIRIKVLKIWYGTASIRNSEMDAYQFCASIMNALASNLAGIEVTVIQRA